jgi:cytochrome d ubiquinol oxidase subunit I
MVGLGTLMLFVSLWYAAAWVFRRDMPKSRGFLVVASALGVIAVITMEAGWVVSEVGRQPWIVYNLQRVDQAATGNTGVWVMFVAVIILYSALAVTTVYVLRGVSRRFRGTATEEVAVPYGPTDEVEREDQTAVPAP